jgi:chromosome segregation ATPase
MADKTSPSDDAFRKAETKLASLRATAAKMKEASWLKRATSSSQKHFGMAVVEALESVVAGFRKSFATQEVRVGELEQEIRNLQQRLGDAGQQLLAFNEQRERLAIEHEALRREFAQLAAGQDEVRERIQHLLDEQRVSIRQLALKTSEEAVLADRARRATELRLEELARRLPGSPA